MRFSNRVKSTRLIQLKLQKDTLGESLKKKICPGKDKIKHK